MSSRKELLHLFETGRGWVLLAGNSKICVNSHLNIRLNEPSLSQTPTIPLKVFGEPGKIPKGKEGMLLRADLLFRKGEERQFKRLAKMRKPRGGWRLNV